MVWSHFYIALYKSEVETSQNSSYSIALVLDSTQGKSSLTSQTFENNPRPDP